MSEPYRIFDVVHAGKVMLSPHMARITFKGEQVRQMATFAPDQRIKLFFPKRDGTLPAIPHRPDWYDVYRALPPRERVPMRTYTIRSLRAAEGEVDVDFVVHGDEGPASRWAIGAAPGDPIQICAPNALYEGDQREVGGFEWKPPQGVKRVLLIADETALPAVAGILEELAGQARPPQVQAFVEIPDAADWLPLPQWPSLEIHWLPREAPGTRVDYGAPMVAAVERAWLPARANEAADASLGDIDVDEDVLWDRADTDGDFYAWVAGETAAVSRIRTALVKERRIDRRALNLMGYWRVGRVRE